MDAGMQLYRHGEVKDWGSVGKSAAQGALTGAVAGLTGGASLAVQATATGAANGIAGAARNAIEGKPITAKGVALDVAIGAGGIAGGRLTGQALKALSGRLAKVAGAAGETENVVRAMSKAELASTRETGLVRGGRDGIHYATNSASNDAQRVLQRLALPVKPQVKVTLKVPRGAFSEPTKVKPDYGMPGGGLERTATGKVPAEVIKVTPLKNQ